MKARSLPDEVVHRGASLRVIATGGHITPSEFERVYGTQTLEILGKP